MKTDNSKCTTCHERQPMHKIWQHGGERRLCCQCYVGEGNPPADWHTGCMAAYDAKHKTKTVAAMPKGELKHGEDK